MLDGLRVLGCGSRPIFINYRLSKLLHEHPAQLLPHRNLLFYPGIPSVPLSMIQKYRAMSRGKDKFLHVVFAITPRRRFAPCL